MYSIYNNVLYFMSNLIVLQREAEIVNSRQKTDY